MSIRTIFWESDAVVMIDQKALPLEERYLTCKRYEDVITAIKDLTVRGAPAIGVAAAMGIALGTLQISTTSAENLKTEFYRICDCFSQTRPTARNLFWAIERMKRCFEKALASDMAVHSPAQEDQGAFSHEKIRQILIAEAIRIGEEDIAINRRMGLNGRSLIKDGDHILTHCNAGALATAGYGTALGVIRAAREEGKNIHVFVDETRPVLQGARLTAWELMKEGIPATLIADNMAGFLMQQGKVNLVITGADRIAANGDTANKIGTYGLDVIARYHGVPFYVAAPTPTIDTKASSGASIVIEERSTAEVTYIKGACIAPKGVKARHPAFDVTPASLITAIITEKGVITPVTRANVKKNLSK